MSGQADADAILVVTVLEVSPCPEQVTVLGVHVENVEQVLVMVTVDVMDWAIPVRLRLSGQLVLMKQSVTVFRSVEHYRNDVSGGSTRY